MTGQFRPRVVWEGVKPVMLMLLVQALYSGVAMSYKLAAEVRLNLRVLIAYRYMFAAAFMAPLALVVERKRRPKLTWTVLCQAFCCGALAGTVAQNLYAQSIALTSATYAAAMANLIPAFTFIIAVLLGLEKLQIRRAEGLAKVVGTLTGIGGAMVLTFYNGEEIHLWMTHISLVHHQRRPSSHGQSGRWIAGSTMSVGSCLSYAIYLVVQTKMVKRYPCHFSSTALTSMMGAAQATVVALCTNRDRSQWKLGWNTKLLVASYTGIVGSGISVALVAWCMHMRGPLFGSVFSPLALVFVALAGSLFLNEDLHAGSVVGAAVIVVGLYVVLWGKSKELRRLNKDQKMMIPSKSCELETPPPSMMIEHPGDGVTSADGTVGSPESHPIEVKADGKE